MNSRLDQQKALEGQLKSAVSEILVDGQTLVKLQELQRVADANKNIYEQFLSRYKTTNEQRLLQTSQAKIASAATPPVHSTRPPLALLLAGLALASMLTSGASVALLDARAQPSEPEPSRPAAAPATPKPRRDIPVWAIIPLFVPREVRKSVWQKPIVSIGEPDASPYLADLIEKISDTPGDGAKVAVVTSVEIGAGASTVARSLNLTALNSALISALIEVQPNAATSPRVANAANEASRASHHASRASLRSVNQLLGNGQDDIRADFDLIVVDAPPLCQQAEFVSLLAQADVVILVTCDVAADQSDIENARTLVSKSGSAKLGLVINQAQTKVARPRNPISGVAC